MPRTAAPALLTTGKIARDLGVPDHRVAYVIRTRTYICHKATAGIIKLYDDEAVAQIRQALNGIAARRQRIVV